MGVLHVPTMRANLISVALWDKVGMKVSIESNKIILTKNNIFVGKVNCNHELYVLNIINDNIVASTYMIESISLWHTRVGHINNKYIKNMKSLGLISNLESSNFDKYKIYAKA